MLRSGSRIEEIAILIDDVLYYTLPCIAELVFPDTSWFATGRITQPLSAVSSAVMDHGDILQECHYLLHSISSQISILVAGHNVLKVTNAIRNHRFLPLHPPVLLRSLQQQRFPRCSHHSRHLRHRRRSPKASSARSTFTSMPITLVATSTNLAEAADLIEPVQRQCIQGAQQAQKVSEARSASIPISKSQSSQATTYSSRPCPTSDHRGAAPKAPPAVKAMPACRPSKLTRGR